MQLFDVIQLPFCTVLRTGVWNAPPHRYFIAYHAAKGFRHLIGFPVIDEFATFSTPIFIAPHSILGKIYDAGITLGHLRDPEMGIDLGWPPVCVGIDQQAPKLPAAWQEELLQAIKNKPPGKEKIQDAGEFHLQIFESGEVRIVATDAPLLPRQLQRICRKTGYGMNIAFATGNRISRADEGRPISVRVLSESGFSKILAAL